MKKYIIIAISLLLVIFSLFIYTSNFDVRIREASKDFKDNVSLCYEAFPIAFRDSNQDGIGDIKGITDSLDYLSDDLQIDCLWITPIHPSTSYHKYDVSDYRAIDQMFGTLDDYHELIIEAHKRDIRVVMDLVINHTAYNHPWFDAWKKGDEDYLDYYSSLTEEEYQDLKSTKGWHRYQDRYYFGSFWDKMPELNYENPKVLEEIYDIAKYWLDFGVDGFRIDAAKHIYDMYEYPELDTLQENIDFFIEFNDVIKRHNKDSFMIGEVWTDSKLSSKYLEGMDSVFNFNFGEELVDAINGMDSTIINRSITETYGEFKEVREDAIISNFLSNHDQSRIMNKLVKNKDKMVQAVANLMMQPGISWIYYGEEIGMTGTKPDERIREPFLWVEEGMPNSTWIDIQANDSSSLEKQLVYKDSFVNIYKELIDIRQNSDVIKKGDFAILEFGRRIFAFERSLDDNKILVISNLQHLENIIAFDGSNYQILFSNKKVSSENGKLIIPGNTTIIFGSIH